ncbi:glutathione peroxidase [Niveibacterium umoris]|uniref:Glutathione peroxidase n=2 Tax=Niveibacterium umoris TaxID=1193620 RepID=A0A840BQJ1_9RHOO|nr:glutathione peroxidase [Niveibacterium umoris]MBB4012687.1 glutathione peroxidase [Niveibacterium umoris]
MCKVSIRAALLRTGLIAFLAAGPVAAFAASACPALLDHSFKRLAGGDSLSLCEFSGKVVLAVNTASFCGNTPQYEGLERLYGKYAARGLVVVGFPSNDFGQQEPGSEKEIAEFCKMTYGVKFPMVSNTVVSGSGAHPFFKQLAKASGAVPKWNFHKYLIDRSGTQVVSFENNIAPEDPAVIARIEAMLRAR